MKEFKDLSKRLERRRAILLVLAAVFAALSLLFRNTNQSVASFVMIGIGVVLFLASRAQVFFWRCPKCKGKLPTGYRGLLRTDTEACPHCFCSFK